MICHSFIKKNKKNIVDKFLWYKNNNTLQNMMLFKNYFRGGNSNCFMLGLISPPNSMSIMFYFLLNISAYGWVMI